MSTLSERKEAADLIHPLDIHCLRSFSRIAKLPSCVYVFFCQPFFPFIFPSVTDDKSAPISSDSFTTSSYVFFAARLVPPMDTCIFSPTFADLLSM